MRNDRVLGKTKEWGSALSQFATTKFYTSTMITQGNIYSQNLATNLENLPVMQMFPPIHALKSELGNNMWTSFVGSIYEIIHHVPNLCVNKYAGNVANQNLKTSKIITP